MENEKGGLFKIGEVASLFNISVQTLRLYEKMGLFSPAMVNESTGYRFYVDTQFDRLRIIIFLKDLGLPLKTIGNLLKVPQGEEYIHTLEVYRNLLEKRIMEDSAKKKFLEEKIENLRMASKLPDNQVLFLHFPELRVVRYDQAIISGKEHELALLDFMKSCRLSPALCNIGQLFEPEHLILNGMICSNAMFAKEELCEEIPENMVDHVYRDVFPEGIYATMYYHKRTEESLPYINALLNETKRHSFTPLGNVIRTVEFEVGDTGGKETAYLSCIRILVKQF